MNGSALDELRLANPVSLLSAEDLAAATHLDARVLTLPAWHPTADEDPPTRLRSRGQRSARTFAVAGIGVAVAVLLLTTPALALVRDVLPFWGAASAPQTVQVEFSSMNTGAPTGMSPQAVSGDTREIGEFTFAGGIHTLWAAPARTGGFCFLWAEGWGGCDTTRAQALTWNGGLVLPAGVKTPDTPAPKPGSALNASSQAIMKARDLAVPTWISGYVQNDARAVVIKFSDGSTVHPQITWVSAPISAGFFAYDIPKHLQTDSDHLVSLDALDATGAVVATQPLH